MYRDNNFLRVHDLLTTWQNSFKPMSSFASAYSPVDCTCTGSLLQWFLELTLDIIDPNNDHDDVMSALQQNEVASNSIAWFDENRCRVTLNGRKLFGPFLACCWSGLTLRGSFIECHEQQCRSVNSVTVCRSRIWGWGASSEWHRFANWIWKKLQYAAYKYKSNRSLVDSLARSGSLQFARSSSLGHWTEAQDRAAAAFDSCKAHCSAEKLRIS